ncbi:hypothetical protein TPHA_0E03310 [Tetrapisispora phaffii CBS 4417]|uniref:Ribosomal protein/NADH dehydrogenase domain-containing protein n=1 Tax=Tetrapisispora phaffii (strain ATCC 24235 / CBS 4417 / NBRC 1672 / NRRL Y-8282 / UCD 70-5) TaxID=1071381 RepID=G8BU43_TETPH|nr:mitochondrial 54S ribosomal protein MRP49 TPHA_0E03310 [Tetrapisispora phaffii CBS 4417]CCE63421.1 hypothetical protein TPHA_0E03310 [Tetrapisispora phaffii CBS 4417]
MSSIGKQLKFLNKISLTTKPTQILINPDKYHGLKLTFQFQNHNGHMGARKFWREYLPTLKFYNPELNIDVVRIKNEDRNNVSVPCVMEITSKTGTPLATIDMRNKRDSEIVTEFLGKIQHTVIPEEDLIKV